MLRFITTLTAVLALTVVTAAAAPSYAFDVKKFWETQQLSGK